MRIGSRGSKLALWQANWVKDQLESNFPGLTVTIEIIKTTGDRYQEMKPPEAMPRGLFTKEIQDAMLNNEVDIAVHSLKDLSTDQNEALKLAAITKRADPRDAFISPHPGGFQQLPIGAKLGTSSTRRRSQLLNLRPDLVVEEIRGNVDTRLRKLDEGQYDAIILAVAGLTRLGLADRICEYLTPEVLLPAVGQGALGIEIRANDSETERYVSVLNDQDTRNACLAERTFLAALGGGCLVPIAGFAEVHNAQLTLRGAVASLDGQTVIRDVITGMADEYERLGRELAAQIISAGADRLIESYRANSRAEQ